jgi:outer membrane protein assembly factor BamB
VWAFAGSGKLACFDLDGKEVWDADLRKYSKTGKFRIQFGCHWTPVLYQGKLYMQVMHQDCQKIVKLDAATGKEEWAIDRPGYGEGESPDVYASVTMWEGEGGPLLVAHGNDYCTGHKLNDGAEVWRVMALNPRNNGQWRFVSNVMVSPDLIVVPSCKDGPLVAFNPVGAKGEITPDNKSELWRIMSTAQNRPTPDVVAPLRVDDIVYILADGPLTAREAKTGKEIYRKNVSPGIHRANMVYADGKIYITGRDGTIDVVQPGPEFKVLATNTIPDYILGSPAVANGRIYLHGWGSLWCIGTK